MSKEKSLLDQDDERRRLEVESRQETERWEEHNRRKKQNQRKEDNNNRREEEKEKQERRKKAFVSRVRQRSGGVIGLVNNTSRSVTFTSTRFLMERSQVLDEEI